MCEQDQKPLRRTDKQHVPTRNVNAIGPRAVNDGNNKIGFVNDLTDTLHTAQLNRIGRLTESGRVDQSKPDRSDIDDLRHIVPRRSRLMMGYRPFISKYRVEKRTLSRVRLTEQRDSRDRTEGRLRPIGSPHFGDQTVDILNNRSKRGSIDELVPLFGKVEPELDRRKGGENPLTQLQKTPAERTTQLTGGRGQEIGLLGLEQTRKSIDLRKIETTVRKSTLRELSSLGSTKPDPTCLLEDEPHDERVAMKVDLDNILSRKRPWSRKPEKQSLIDDFSASNDVDKICPPRFRLASLLSRPKPDERTDRLENPRPGKAYD